MTNSFPLLSFLVLLPLAGCLLLLPVWKRPRVAFPLTLGIALAEFALTLRLFADWQGMAALPSRLPGFFLLEDLPWIPFLGIRYTLGLDGISLLMVMLTAFTFCTALLVSWRAITEKTGMFLFLMLLMESGIMGVFLALDLALFYLFWEVMLIPMFFLIGIWGHGRRLYSTVKFFLFTLAGSLLMLLAIIALHLLHAQQTGVATFGLYELLQNRLPLETQLWLYAAFLLAFAIKFPLFPLHTWLPDAHTDAPTAGSVILAGLLLKTGSYGLIRFGYPLFPQAAQVLTPLVYALALIGLVYASLVAFAQEDMKRLIAYSSIGHMGYVAIGIAAWQPVALSGAIIQMANHGVTTGALFCMVGMLDERAHTRDIRAFGGLWGKVPLWSFFFLLFSLASVGLPGLNNFVGEFLVLAGTMKQSPLVAALAFVGIVLTLIYTVRLVQEVLFQQERQPLPLLDLNRRELCLLAVLALLNIWMGIHPAPLLDLIHTPVQLLIGGVP
ncbi:NuoM family protein [Geobacter sp. SVR]|uniref:complex I subunit 4 family protein n=1 Tax=Geobacter sp. SVR TaxID=2495594 RepID=UPI00143EFA93|nr:NADH-quinone oxidoreductase subunit M [Geobacter sp. SVR]BCS52319.1 NADH dehydrogenase subunit M [Geobacter sp. SVR]GCF85022.1 NADH dehydrogenase subunit M [Geobacter sp. SVR]